jgi:Tfp pilus assembly protein PilO
MTGILKRLHLFILIYAGFVIYTEYEKNQKELVELNNRIPTLKRQIKKAEKEKENLERYFKDIEEAKGRIEKVAIGIEKLQKKLPPNISDTENLDLLRGIAESLNIKNVLLSPGNEEVHGFFVSKDYKLKGSGTFLQYLILLEKIGEQERILNIKNVSFNRSRAKQKGRFQLLDAEIVLEAFRFNEKYKEDRGIKEIEESFKKKPKRRARKPKKKGKG